MQLCRNPRPTRSGVKQSRLMSLVEAIANVVVGYGIAVLTQVLAFPAFGLQATLSQNLQLAALFSAISVFRAFVLRRAFEAARVRAIGAATNNAAP